MGFKTTRLNPPETAFTMIRRGFHRDSELSDAAHRVGCYLLTHTDTFVLTERRVAEHLARSNQTVRKALGDLEGRRYLVRPTNRRGRGAHHEYVLCDQALTDDEVCQIRARLDAATYSVGAENAPMLGVEGAPRVGAETALHKETTSIGEQSKQAVLTSLSDEWVPSLHVQQFAAEREIHLAEFMVKFREKTAGTRSSDWDNRCLQWLIRERPATSKQGGRGSVGGVGPDGRVWQE
ncbi:hypothetical protein GS545_13160 [Rhodococcus hoagii]|nr:hypothetical protein [Prescottella equi]